MTQANTGSGGPAVPRRTADDDVAGLLAGLAANEPVVANAALRSDHWVCAYCDEWVGPQWCTDWVVDQDQWRRSGRFIVDHTPDCPWLASARWLDPDAAAGDVNG